MTAEGTVGALTCFSLHYLTPIGGVRFGSGATLTFASAIARAKKKKKKKRER
jgi:hypothetical protein